MRSVFQSQKAAIIATSSMAITDKAKGLGLVMLVDTGGLGDITSFPLASSSAAGRPRLCWEEGRGGQLLGGGASSKKKTITQMCFKAQCARKK